MAVGLWSCSKPVICEGVVYSKHHIPMPDTRVNFNVYGSASNYPTYFTQTTTDANGRFYFNVKVNNRHAADLECRNDSGYAKMGVERTRNSNAVIMDLILR